MKIVTAIAESPGPALKHPHECGHSLALLSYAQMQDLAAGRPVRCRGCEVDLPRESIAAAIRHEERLGA